MKSIKMMLEELVEDCIYLAEMNERIGEEARIDSTLKEFSDIVLSKKKVDDTVLLPAYLENDFENIPKLEVAQRAYTIGCINGRNEILSYISQFILEEKK